MTKVSIWEIMMSIMICVRVQPYFWFMNSMYIASVFSVLTFIASTGIILFMRAIRLSKQNAVKQGLYLILVSFICGIAMMSWVISNG